MRNTRVLCAGSAAALFATVPLAAQARQDDTVDMPAWHVTEVTSTVLEETSLSGRSGVATDRVRDSDGKVVGYDSYSLRFGPKRVVVRIGLALKGGVILATLVARSSDQQGQDLVFRGPIQGGNGVFDGIRGTARAVVPGGDTQAGTAIITLRWRTPA